MNKKLLLILSISLVGLLYSSFGVSAVGEVSYCCEKTIEGAWCQNAPEENCNPSFNMQPTSCESTAYCRLGCCYDSEEGNCMENTPQKVCDEFNGAWKNSAECEIPQCSLGCCILGDQAAFVTNARCNRLSSIYNLESNFQSNIKSEVQCIASVTSDVKGACVYEDQDFQKTCRTLSKRECDKKASFGNETSFHGGFLCTADELDTNCRPTKETTCVDGKDEVYFVDTCGNVGNIYDASKINDREYWTKMRNKDESCSSNSGNADSKTCGNCDYYLGSTCKSYERGEDKARPQYGDNICRDLGCEYEGEEYSHGETWCADAPGTSFITPTSKASSEGENVPGSRYFRMLCYNGEVTVEPCADFRQQVCVQDEINGIKTANCVVNKWQDCTEQDNQEGCENNDRRDCVWMEEARLNQQQYETTEVKSAFRTGSEGENEVGNIPDSKGACVPKFAPGFDFWGGRETQSICSLASATCVVTFAKGLLGSGRGNCVENCECLEGWEDEMNKVCTSIGDCGSSVNYIGVEGFHDAKAFYSGIKEDEKEDDDEE